MKKISLMIMAITLMGMTAIAQNMYVRLGVGAAVSTASSMAYSYDETGSADMEYSKKNGYGTGLPFALGAGYFLGENVGIELGVNYFMGFSTKTYDKDDYRESNSKTSGQMLSIIPALVVRVPLDNISPYARIGLMVGVMNSVVTKMDITVKDSPQKATTLTDLKIKESGGIALGVQSAVGADFKLGELLSLFGEIQVSGISFSPKKGVIKEYEVDGTDNLGNLTTKQKEWEYVKDLDYTKNIPDGSPDEMSRVNYHFNNVGLTLGLKINL